MKKVVLLAFVSVLFSTAVFVEFIRPVEASGTFYISSDYTFTSNIYEPIVVTADNIIIDGAGYTVQGNGSGIGINMTWRSNVTLKNVEVTNFNYGIYLASSSHNTVTGNTASNNTLGIRLASSSHNTVTGNTASSNVVGIVLYGSSNNNTVTGNTASNNEYGMGLSASSNNVLSGNTASSNDYEGIYLESSSNNNTVTGNTASNNDYGIYLHSSSNNNTVTGNTASNNDYGIMLEESSNNIIYHNNFINNTEQVYDGSWTYPWMTPSINVWDDDVEGNYWSDYDRVDSDYDGIGDKPYVIDENNQDNYPLMGMFSDFLVTHQEETYHTSTICSSIISDFQFNDVAKTISFNITGPDYTLGFCRVTIPNIIIQDLWQGNYTVLVDGEDPIMMNNWTVETYTYIYFIYLHSEHKVEIIPEFPAFLILPLFMIATLLAVIVYRRKHSLKQTIKNQLRARMEGLKLFRKRK